MYFCNTFKGKSHSYAVLLLVYSVVLELSSRTLCVLSECSATDLHTALVRPAVLVQL